MIVISDRAFSSRRHTVSAFLEGEQERQLHMCGGREELGGCVAVLGPQGMGRWKVR